MSMQGEGQGHAPRRSLLFTPPASPVLASRYLSAGILLPLIAADRPDPPSLNACHASVVEFDAQASTTTLNGLRKATGFAASSSLLDWITEQLSTSLIRRIRHGFAAFTDRLTLQNSAIDNKI